MLRDHVKIDDFELVRGMALIEKETNTRHIFIGCEKRYDSFLFYLMRVRHQCLPDKKPYSAYMIRGSSFLNRMSHVERSTQQELTWVQTELAQIQQQIAQRDNPFIGMFSSDNSIWILLILILVVAIPPVGVIVLIGMALLKSR